MVAILDAWLNRGASRLDGDLDGKIQDPGAAIMDAAWSRIADAVMSPRLGSLTDRLAQLIPRSDDPSSHGSSFDSGWYVDASAAGGGDGSSEHPFNSLAPLNGTANDGTTVGDVDSAGDIIYLEGGSFSSGITLETNAKLISRSQGLVVSDGAGGAGTVTLDPASGSNAVINGVTYPVQFATMVHPWWDTTQTVAAVTVPLFEVEPVTRATAVEHEAGVGNGLERLRFAGHRRFGQPPAAAIIDVQADLDIEGGGD